MALAVGCPRCATPVARIGAGGTWSCPEHGVVRPVRRPEKPSYDDFVAHLDVAGAFPTYLPWPLEPGWSVTDFAVVGDMGSVSATLMSVGGFTAPDGHVEVIVVAEETGVGLGARCARTPWPGPGAEAGAGPSTARVRAGGQQVPLWPLTQWTNGAEEWERSVLVGEADGRWLWLIFRPASAALLLQDDWQLRDVTELGPAMVELPFGGAGGTW
ncbi:MAG: hypothetical protein J2O46_04365 [Nocardioides sp.]|nr:hypothetical protein [Nocardioides sp.]